MEGPDQPGEPLSGDLEQLDRVAVEHLTTHALGGIEVDIGLVAVRITQQAGASVR
jgi:hypothetical protein